MAISVLVADDHQLVAAALRAAFARDGDILIVGETHEGAEVAALVAALRPDVLLLDLTMPDVDGLEVLRRLSDGGAAVRVVVLSMHTTASYASRALKLGALGYVGKSAPATELVQAIRAAASGARYLAPPLSDDAVREYDARIDADRLDPFETLTNREREVMRQTAGRIAPSRRRSESASAPSRRTSRT